MKFLGSQRKLFKWALFLIPPLWLFNYYVMIPICMPFSKPITMYMTWSDKQIAQGTPKKITFRIPSAYLLPYRTYKSSGGQKEFIDFAFDRKNDRAACLWRHAEPLEKKVRSESLIHVDLRPSISRQPDDMERSICTKYPEIVSDIEGFRAYEGPNRCYIPIQQSAIPIFFNCMKADKIRGCEAWTYYKGMRLRYSLNQSYMIENWQEVHSAVLKKINQFVVSIDE